MATRVLVVGVGGIGGNLLGRLGRHDPAAVGLVGFSRNPAVLAAARSGDLRLRDHDGERRFGATVIAELEGQAPFDFVLLATQPPQVEQAAADVLPWLVEDGAMVVLQNGLCEDRIAAIAGPDRVLGAVVAWGASSPEPGLFERTSDGGFTLGRMDGAPDERLFRLSALLEVVGPVELTKDLAGARWTKLALNCAVSTLGTIGGDRLGRLMPHLFARRLALHLMTEVVEVARAEGVKLGRVAGTLDLDWIALKDSERGLLLGSPTLVAKHTLLLAVGARYRRMRSSMLAAIERGRPPAVDHLNGEVVERGRALGVPTPVNEAAWRTVHAIARGEKESGLATLHALAAEVGLLGWPPQADLERGAEMA